MSKLLKKRRSEIVGEIAEKALEMGRRKVPQKDIADKLFVNQCSLSRFLRSNGIFYKKKDISESRGEGEIRLRTINVSCRKCGAAVEAVIDIDNPPQLIKLCGKCKGCDDEYLSSCDGYGDSIVHFISGDTMRNSKPRVIKRGTAEWRRVAQEITPIGKIRR